MNERLLALPFVVSVAFAAFLLAAWRQLLDMVLPGRVALSAVPRIRHLVQFVRALARGGTVLFLLVFGMGIYGLFVPVPTVLLAASFACTGLVFTSVLFALTRSIA